MSINGGEIDDHHRHMVRCVRAPFWRSQAPTVRGRWVGSSGSGGTSPTFRIPDGSTSGVVHLDTTSALLANYAFPDAWFETPIKVVSRAAAGSINDGSAPSNAYFILTLAELT